MSRKRALKFLPALMIAVAFTFSLQAETTASEVVGVVSDVLQENDRTRVIISDRDFLAHDLVVSPSCEIKRQLESDEINEGDYAAIIYEAYVGDQFVLSAIFGSEEAIDRVEEPIFEEVGQEVQTEMPEGPPPPQPPAGQGQAGDQPQGTGEEATGFSKEEAEKAKREKDTGGHILQPTASPLESAEEVIPGFYRGRVLSVDRDNEPAVMTMQSEDGSEESFLVEEYGSVLNQFEQLSFVQEGDRVSVKVGKSGENNMALSIVIVRPEA